MPIPSWLSNFIGFGWIRDLLGIRKDLIDTKKSKLEVKKLEDDERARNLITPATIDDVKKYDPKYRAITIRVKDSEYSELVPTAKGSRSCLLVAIIFWVVVALTLTILLYLRRG